MIPRVRLPPRARAGALLAAMLAAAGPALAQQPRAPSPASEVDPLTGAELVRVAGGCFQMGDIYNHAPVTGDEETLNERPVHEVCLSEFLIGRYEVTRGQWREVMGADPSTDSICPQPSCPVDNVTWDQIQVFLGKLNAGRRGGRYRLPTEAEWEYAARSGGRNERYAGGNDADSVGWYVVTSGLMLTTDPAIVRPAGSKAPNGLGLFDMSGNVYEFTSDWYAPDYYARSPRDDPKGPETGTEHVVRGGCASGGPSNTRVARRRSQGDWSSGTTGFRLARDP